MFNYPINDVKELVHDRSDDDDLRFALRFEACGKFFADRIVAHRGHGRKKQVLTQLTVARFTHGGSQHNRPDK